MIDSNEIEADEIMKIRNGHAVWLRAAAESVANGGKFDTAYLRRLADAFDAMEDAEEEESAQATPDAMAAERRGSFIMLESEPTIEDLPLPGAHLLSAEERLVELIVGGSPKVAAVAEAVEMAGELPVPAGTLSLEDTENMALYGRSVPKSAVWGGEMAGELAVPR